MADQPSNRPSVLPLNPLRTACFLRSAATVGQLPRDDQPEVAFVGRSNAGKSTALNTLCDQRALARVSRTPGRTQLINLFELANNWRLVDLPGYGYARAPVTTRNAWEQLVGAYVAERRNLRGVVVLMDIRHPLPETDQQMLAWAQAHARPVHILLTKADKLGRGAGANSLVALRHSLAGYSPKPTVQMFSAPRKQGVEAARQVVVRWLASSPTP